MTDRHPRIVVDARMATDGGIGTYIQALLPRIAALRPQWNFAFLGDAAGMRAVGWGALPNVALRQYGARIFSLGEQVFPRADLDDADLYWAPYYNVPVLMRRPLALTVHDVNHLALPELMGGPVRRSYARWLMTSAMRRAACVLFDSEFTRRETARLLGHDANGTVVHAAVEEDWTRSRALAPDRPMPEPFFLYVGNIKRHKNVPFLLRAFRRILDRLPHRVVLIGRTEGLRADPDVAAALGALGQRALMLGEVSRPVLMQYVAHAEALVNASLYEGFGLPALEAMAAGCPCIVSTAGSLPEVCGDAALYAEPRDETSFAARMLEVAHDPALRSTLIARGRVRASQFSWDRSAAETTAVLERALS